MKPIEFLTSIFISAILILSCIAPFFGVNFFTTTISDLGFFLDNRILHDTFAVITFLGGILTVLFYSVKRKKWRDLLFLIPFVLMPTFLPIFEWIAFWGLGVYILKEIFPGYLQVIKKFGKKKLLGKLTLKIKKNIYMGILKKFLYPQKIEVMILKIDF